MNKRYLAAAAVLLSGCSSPPEPLPVEWNKTATVMNTDLNEWQPNNSIIPSPAVNGHWSKKIANFNTSNIFTPAIWYAVAHSSKAVISSPDSQGYFSAKAWLRNGGYKGLIKYTSKINCFNCTTTDIYLSR
ncbi:cag pathogenicity island Cag12 family protein [Raoultella terrigena]|uniref:cag pathogenicity island Cag12 family protein n=1 Tax=Raoultella terrigena TaxID=577 RepID=UPI000907DF2F|nr:cag pathogenicity island Cag12 family protein [Raoultella terrigena]